MSARLTKLRIAGFKSFAEPVSLDILPGLTGIVGPNGCGKSNVVEALRWAMGEASAQSLRGAEMDDVIFAGTTARASRNLAEVSVTLEAGMDALPAPFEAEAELEVTRRIERGAGSAFRANGRELRARDVQTLYADLASGARSSGMVSQGRVADLVRGRPEDRRSVLEEAAGITGLHARRSEAELKLRAAEQNLSRAEDLCVQLDGTREGLRGQARQAARYRAISGLIRAAEAEHLGVLHGQAAAALALAQVEEKSAGQALCQASIAEREAAEALAGAEARLPGPRHEEAAARTMLERRRLEAETLGEDAARAAREADEAASRLRDLASDLAHGEDSRTDAQASVARLEAECARQAAELSVLPAASAHARQTLARAREALAAAQAVNDEAARLAAAGAAAAQQAGDAQRWAEERWVVLRSGHAALACEHGNATAARLGADALATSGLVLSEAEAVLRRARAAVQQAEAARGAAVALAVAGRARAETAAAARRAAETLAGDAAERTLRQQAVCEAAATALAQYEARRVPAGEVHAITSAAASAAAASTEADETVSSAELATVDAQEKAASARLAAEAGNAALGRAAERLSGLQEHARKLGEELAAAEAALAAAQHSAVPADDLAAMQAACRAAEQAHAACSGDYARLEDARETAGRLANRARLVLAACQAEDMQLGAEACGLEAALGQPGGDVTVFEDGLAALDVPDGLQAAVGAALGELGRASLDSGAPCFWRTLPGLPPVALPQNSVALSDMVGAPAAFARALSYVALLADGVDGQAIQAGLAPGAVAVDRAGACWRWDGYVKRAAAPNWAATRLGLRSRLSAARHRSAQAAEATRAADAARAAADACEAAADAAAQAALTACRSAERDWRQTAQAFERVDAKAAQADARLAMLKPAAFRLQDEYRTAAAEAVSQAAVNLPDGAILEQSRHSTAALARTAAVALESARSARIAARRTAEQAREAAHGLVGAASVAEAHIAAAAAALVRAQAELAALRLAEREAQVACSALPDLAQLQSAAQAASADEVVAGSREAAAYAGREAASADEVVAGSREAAAYAGREAAEAGLDRARQDHASLHSADLQAAWQVASLAEQLGRNQAELDAAHDAMLQAAFLMAALPCPQASGAAAEAARQTLERAREATGEAEAKAAAIRADMGHAERALSGLQAELDAWKPRLAEAVLRQASLAERHVAARMAWSALRSQPAEMALRAARSGAALTEAAAIHAAAEAALAAADQHVRNRSAALREAALQAGNARDRQVRAQASCRTAAAVRQTVLARAAERLDGAAIPEVADPSAMAEERARRKLERFGRERDAMGPVNLRADIELEVLDGRIGTLEQQRAELGAAIDRLRSAIGVLNRDGRARLNAVFAEVDRHFRSLFTSMMGGGRAHLALTGSDDPLAAGLEIYAEPPGKRLSALSLLSGGEQALTALSLIFAVFRCTPAPLCVLDEVDAALDDANVERFCTLLDEMVRNTGTSFLVVTHHQLTMSRMDRLFGVTMQERGVSRLLSVDLRSAAAAAAEPWLKAAE